MKTIKITYTVQSSFAAQNQVNIQTFITDLQKINNPALRYLAYLGEDGKTFTHLATYANEEAQDILLNLPSFQAFQKQRDDSGLEISPRIETMQLVDSSYALFN